MSQPPHETPDGSIPEQPTRTVLPATPAPGSIACPVCERIIPLPAPDDCPHCFAPIQTVISLLRTADLSLTEALRDIRSGDLDPARRRLELIRSTSKRHRLKVEIVHAMIERLSGNPADAIARMKAARERMSDEELIDLGGLADETESLALKDQDQLALCCELHNFALFQARKGHLEESRSSLVKALEAVPHHAPSRALLGKVYLALGDESNARVHLRRALASDPSNPTATRLLTQMGDLRPRRQFKLPLPGIFLSPTWAFSTLVLIILATIAVAAFLSR